jgi:UDP-glucose 4-epimerase
MMKDIKNVLVTGGAGFIGSHLCEALLVRDYNVCCVDNLYLGREEFIEHLKSNPRFHFFKLDLLDKPELERLFAETEFDVVFHLAANSDIQRGGEDHDIDLSLNLLTTVNVLEAMLQAGVKKIVFPSSSAVFGETDDVLTEDYGPLKPVSFYGASKLAAEAYISVFVENYGFQAWIIRFPNVIGERCTHGVVHDFIKRLKSDPSRLAVLGNGKQTKPYLYVEDLVAAILLVFDQASEELAVYHVGNEDRTSVAKIVEIVLDEMDLTGIPVEYAGGTGGWAGDVPRFQYDIGKIKSLGFKQSYNSTESVRIAVRRILETPWL